MTRLSERLKEIGIDDPGAEDDPGAHLRQLEEVREHVEERIQRAKERQERDRRALAEENRVRRERFEAEHRKRQKRHQRVIGFFGELGVRGIVARPVDCWSARCRERRSGLTVPPALHVNPEDGSWWCQDCPSRGGLVEAARAHGVDPVPLLRRYGFDEQAELLVRRAKALATINGKLEHIGRDDHRWGELRSARDAAAATSLEELERVAEQASKMRRKAAA
jgi:hypothetical protein